MNRRDGNVHIAILHRGESMNVLAKLRWDSDFKFKSGLIGGWEVVAVKK